MNAHTIAAALIHAGRFSYKPRYSLFATSSKGEYTPILLNNLDAIAVAAAFIKAAINPVTCGLEVRCDGIRVAV